MGSPAIFNGSFTKLLTTNLKLKEDLYILHGSDDPTSVAQTAPRGSLYARDTGSTGILYIKTDDGSSTNWEVIPSGTISIAEGGTNATSQTTNGVMFYNGTSITSGSSLTWDSSTLAVTGAFTVSGNATIGDAVSDVHTIRGQLGLDDATSAGNALEFGSGANLANLYRSANDTLRTDDSLSVGGNVTVDGLTASRLVATDGSKVLSSVSDLTSWIAATTDETSVANDGDGTITVGIADNPIIPGTARMKVPTGTTAQRPGTPAQGDLRFNTTDTTLEVYDGSGWDALPSAGAGDGGLGADGVNAVQTTNYTVVSGDNGAVILMDTTSSPLNVTLPAATAGFIVTIKDVYGTTGTNSISILGNAGTEEIDGVLGNAVINTAYRAVTLISDGTDWYRVAVFTGDTIPAGTGLFGGGYTTNVSNVIDYFDLSVASNATDFGDLLVNRIGSAAIGSPTKAFFAGGGDGVSTYYNTIDTVTISSVGNASDWGDLSVARAYCAGSGNSTRGMVSGGSTGSDSNVIDTFIFTTGNNATDYGDLATATERVASFSSQTRSIVGGGLQSSSNTNTINEFTITTTGTVNDWGDLTVARNGLAGCSNSTRGLFGAGTLGAGSESNVIDYITISSSAGATDFGDVTVSRAYIGACSSQTRAVFGGGHFDPGDTNSNVLDTVQFDTIASATDFGDLSDARRYLAGCSNVHGGI